MSDGVAAPSGRAALRTVVGNAALRRIEAAWMLGMGGDAAFVVALIVAAFGYGGPVAVGVLTACRMAPSILGAPLAGLLAGRRPPSRLLLGVHGLRAAGAVVATIGLVVASPPLVLAGATLAASAGAFVRPLQAASMPAIARSPDELVAANVVSGGAEGVGSFGGPLLAGVALGLGGPVGAALVATVAFVAGAAALAGGPAGTGSDGEDGAAERGRPAPAAVSLGMIGRELTAGLRALGRHRGAAVIMAGLAGQVFVRGLLTSFLVVIAIKLVGLGEPGVGLLAAANGLGTLGGAVLAVRLSGSRALGPTFAVSLSAWGLPLAVIAALPHPAVAVVALIVSGLANGVLDVSAFTLLQRTIPRTDRMAVFGLLEAVVAAGLAAGGATAPILIAAFGERGGLAIAGAILPILAIASWQVVQRVDETVVVPERQLRLLRGVPLFAGLTLTALERLAEGLVPDRVAAGTTIIREGEPGRDYFLIERGEVEVRAAGRPINRGGPGDSFGEIALVRNVPRTATVVALTDLELEVLDSADFLAALAGPASRATAAAIIDERLARSSTAG